MSDEPMDEQPDETQEPPDWVAAFDQWRRGAADFAKLIAGYHRALRAEGIDAYTALQLTSAYQHSVIQAANGA